VNGLLSERDVVQGRYRHIKLCYTRSRTRAAPRCGMGLRDDGVVGGEGLASSWTSRCGYSLSNTHTGLSVFGMTNMVIRMVKITILRTIFPTGRKTVALSACVWNTDVADGAENRCRSGVLVPGYPDLHLSAWSAAYAFQPVIKSKQPKHESCF
jgi:hypothetical protein